MKLKTIMVQAIAAVIVLVASSMSAFAQFKLCNSTSSRVGVAIGYRDKDGWTSEGWWNVETQTCSMLIQDKLRARFYYVYALDYDKGGEWGGKIPMCSQDGEFTIRGNDNCEGRGFKKSSFFEVDTQEQNEWTVKLTEQTEPTASADSPAPATATAPAAAGAKSVKR